MNIYDIFETKKGLYYNVNKRKQAGTSRSKNAPEAPSVADWKNAAKTAKEDINEGIEIVYELSEVTGDKPFDKMMKGVTSKTAVTRQQKADRRAEKADNQARAKNAFGNMFGGGNPADKLKIKEQGVEESLRPGEYHVWTVHFEDGTTGRIRVPNDEITDDQIKAHYAKRGKTVVKIDADWAVHSLDEAPVSNFMTAPQQPIDPREQWKRQVRAMAAQYQRNPSMLASLAKEAGPDSVEQVAWEYLQSAAKGIRMPGADTQPAPVNWDDVIRRLPQGLSGQALLNAAEEYLTGTKGMLRSQVRTLLNEPTNQRSLKGAYDRKLQPSESIDELAEAIDSRLYAMKLAGYDIL